MEVAAGYAEHVDVQVGRLVDELDRLGYGDNTLIFYIWGDNGSSGEGQNGTISELLAQNGIPSTVPMHIAALEEIGGLDVLGSPKTDNQYHAGWAWAGSTPVQGNEAPGLPPRWDAQPDGRALAGKIKPDATPRAQFHHCNDLVPTIYEAVGITPPRIVDGVPQDPLDGVSFAYTLRRPGGRRSAAHAVLRDHGQPRDLSRRLDRLGNRTAPPMGARTAPRHSRMDARTTTPGSSTTSRRIGRQASDLAAQMPDKLAQLQDLFLIEATRNKVLPIGGGLWIVALPPRRCA